jgi:hypothetical protein
MDSARLVIGCHSTQGTRVQNAFDHVASIIHQTLPRGNSFNYVCGYMLMYKPHVKEMLQHFTDHITWNEPQLFQGDAKAEPHFP